MTVNEQLEARLSMLTPEGLELIIAFSNALEHDRAKAHQILVGMGQPGLAEFEQQT